MKNDPVLIHEKVFTVVIGLIQSLLINYEKESAYIHTFYRKQMLFQIYSVKYTKRKIPIPQMKTKAEFNIIFILGDS